MAASAAPFAAIIDPDAFLDPGDMPEKICLHCRSKGLQPPDAPASMARTIFESLDLRYRQVLESLEALLGRRIEIIHIVGGGSRNRLLNQFVADATGRTVIAGPSEATAMGNILIQAMGAGELSGLPEVRKIVRNSAKLETFIPHATPEWNQAYEQFREIAQR